MVRYSFLVRLSHPLLHAGLSRRLLDHPIRPRQHAGGIVRPICLAVLRLMTNSTFIARVRQSKTSSLRVTPPKKLEEARLGGVIEIPYRFY